MVQLPEANTANHAYALKMMTNAKRQSERIKVVFLTFYFEAWDALADIHDQMLADPRFEVTVVSIPRRFINTPVYSEEDLVSAYLDSAGVKHLRFDYEDSYLGLEKLRVMAPDYVFINYPWQRNYPPSYRAELLSEFTKVCFVPYYSMPLADEPGVSGIAPHLYEQRSHQLASLVFTQDPHIVDAYALTSRGNSHVHLVGSPKLDSLVRKVQSGKKRWPLNNGGNKRMVWAPHHSYSSDWLNFGMFVKVNRPMLEFAKQHPSLDIVMRPHPYMFSTLIERNVMPKSELDEWLAEWNSLPNTAIDKQSDFADLFAACDIFVTEGISFLSEYPLSTGKPTIFFENEGHWKWSKLGEISALANIHVSNFDEFEKVFADADSNGLPDYSKQIETLRKAAQPYPGEAGARVKQIVIEDFEAGTGLVDKSAIREIPWEDRPGAEPAWA